MIWIHLVKIRKCQMERTSRSEHIKAFCSSAGSIFPVSFPACAASDTVSGGRTNDQMFGSERNVAGCYLLNHFDIWDRLSGDCKNPSKSFLFPAMWTFVSKDVLDRLRLYYILVCIIAKQPHLLPTASVILSFVRLSCLPRGWSQSRAASLQFSL